MYCSFNALGGMGPKRYNLDLGMVSGSSRLGAWMRGTYIEHIPVHRLHTSNFLNVLLKFPIIGRIYCRENLGCNQSVLGLNVAATSLGEI